MTAGPLVIVIPAKNEEDTISKTIRLLQKTRIPMHIIVVDDGSRDRTASRARALGATVIQFMAKKGQKIEVLNKNFQVQRHRVAEKDQPVNRGKTAAFFAGLRAAAKLRPSAVITFDADMVEISSRDLDDLAQYAREATARGKSQMIMAGQREGTGDRNPSTSVSGIRAYSLPAIHQILASSFKNKVTRFGLEPFLNQLFQNHLIEADWLRFRSKTPFRKGKSTFIGQMLDVKRVLMAKRSRKVVREQRRRLPRA